MNKNDLTPWFDGKVKPVRPGVYMQMSGRTFGPQSGGSLGYQYWNGEFWGSWENSPKKACSLRGFAANPSYQNDPWRGLSREPSEQLKQEKQI